MNSQIERINDTVVGSSQFRHRVLTYKNSKLLNVAKNVSLVHAHDL